MNSIPFVGRRAALDFLHQQFALCRTQGPRLVFLSAPAGAGKTALVRHFFQTIDDEGTCATGRGWDNRAAVSYHALRELLAELPSPPSPSSHPLRSLLDGGTGEEIPSLPPEVLFPALVAFLRQETQHRPLCLFLDDLQWADEGTFEWVDCALRRMEGTPVLWIGAYRSEEARSLSALLDRRPEWYQTDRFAEHALVPLSRDEVEELMRQVVPADQWQKNLSEEIWRRSEGLALLTVEEIRALQKGQTNTRGQALIQARLNRLSIEDRQLLSMAAVMGERFSPDPLAAALEQTPLHLVQRLEVLRHEHGLIEEDGTGYRFAHNRYRESLLQSMSQALRRTYHARLGQQTENLTPDERTYHLVRSGHLDEGVQALLSQGEQTLSCGHWRDALRYYTEALHQVQEAQSQDSGLYLSIYQRLGDLHLAIGQHVVARSYYEAARCWVHTPRQQALLLLRLSQTCRGASPQQLGFAQEAADLLPQLSDPNLHLWVCFFQAFVNRPFLSEQGLDHLYELSKQAASIHSIPGYPPEELRWAPWSVIDLAGRKGDMAEVRRQANRLETTTSHSHMMGSIYDALGSAYRINGDQKEGLKYVRQTRKICQSLGRIPHLLEAYNGEVGTLLDIGAYDEARVLLREALQDVKPGSALERLYLYLCRTWIHDRIPEGLDWATKAIRGIEAFYQQFPTDGGHLGGIFYHLDAVERIFRDQDQHDEFRQRIDLLKETLHKAGYQTEAIWYLDGRVDLPVLTQIDPVEDWIRTPGHDQAGIHSQRNTLLFHSHPTQPFVNLTAPRIHRQVTGDFILQATIHASSQVLESLLRCRHQKAQGKMTPLACGCGGLYVIHDKFKYLHLGVHRDEPGQILLEQINGRNPRHWGRGLLDDGPIRLRLERWGTTIFAYTGNEDGDWYACGQIDLPGWDTVEIGLYGAAVACLHQGMIEKSETRFWDIALELKTPQPVQPVSTPTADPLYPLPEPAYAPDLPHFVAADTAMLRLLQRIPQVGRAHLPVLIQGETGTGKELIARAIHQLGDRANGPFVPINCAALTPELIDSLLFGHVRGAYTGAYDTRGGLFEAADQGILFLDEIGDASLELQTHLLRVIEEQAVRRLGEPTLRRVDVRLVTATNRDLPSALAEGAFRQDFYFRLRGMELHLPPLRQRRDDIPYLVSHALRQWSRRREHPLPGITRQAMEALRDHDWPGNVRELLHAVERAAEEADGEPITPTHLGIHPPPSTSASRPSPSSQQEYQRITAALQATDGNVAAAARRLGIGRTTMYRHMHRLGISGR